MLNGLNKDEFKIDEPGFIGYKYFGDLVNELKEGEGEIFYSN
jgi:hypothetical protein